ncbi:g9013 [Coccomyxa viridis]|uniref:G9013 protein n=1 Tax=Coccomyxa viridis TaxID=1274662 RepID=A0ABP1G8J5_9CHLO
MAFSFGSGSAMPSSQYPPEGRSPGNPDSPTVHVSDESADEATNKGMDFGGNCWMLRQSLLLEAKEMDLTMNTILWEHHRCCRDGHSEHGELLREEHRRLARQHATKEKAINTLTNSLVESTLQEDSIKTSGISSHKEHGPPSTRGNPYSEKTFSWFGADARQANASHNSGAPQVGTPPYYFMGHNGHPSAPTNSRVGTNSTMSSSPFNGFDHLSAQPTTANSGSGQVSSVDAFGRPLPQTVTGSASSAASAFSGGLFGPARTGLMTTPAFD